MGTKAAISVEEYLRTSYPDLDREYRDGEVVERTLPDYLHSRIQALLGAFFVAVEKTLHLYACAALRVRLGENLVRIPDVCVFRSPQPPDIVPSTPPFITIEILSPDDRMSEVLAKLEEYRRWGCPPRLARRSTRQEHVHLRCRSRGSPGFARPRTEPRS